MPGFAGLIRTFDAVVTITDSKDNPEKFTGAYKINDKVVAVIYKGIDGATEFCEQHLKQYKNLKSDEIIKKAIEEFNKHHEKFKKFDFSLILISFLGPRKPTLLGLWYDPKGHHAQLLQETVVITPMQDDLIKYLIAKVYSEHMLANELLRLLGFVSLQCIKIFPEIGYDFEIMTFTEDGIKTLSKGEMKELYHQSEKTDHKLKKIFGDFFLNGDVKR